VSQETLDLIQSGGTLVFALLAIGALLTGQVRAKREVEDRDRTIEYERSQKEQAFDKAKTMQSDMRELTEAVKARNLLDQERVRAKRAE